MAKSLYKGSPTFEGQREPVGYEQLTSLSSAAALTIPAGTRLIILQAEDQDIRWRDDGTNPTTSVGMVLKVNDVFLYTGAFEQIRFIETTASAKLNVSYYA